MRRFLILLLVVAFAARGSAQQEQVHKIMGTVSAVHGTHLEVKQIDGKIRDVMLTDATKIFRDTTAVTPADIKAAQRVVITAVEQKDAKGTVVLVAREVHLGIVEPMPPQKPASKPVPGKPAEAHKHPPATPPTAGPPTHKEHAPAEKQPPAAHEHGGAAPAGWHVMQDGVAFLTYNDQGGLRGGDPEIVSQNWWMGMAQRPAAGGTLQFNLMLSLEPLTLGKDGYREIFQVGETLNGFPLIDRQHPHDFLMQAAVVWRKPLPRDYTLTLAGAPVGEPALGPIAFMHRASAFENPTAPLGHHTFDSTHIAMGVLTAGVQRGPWEVESSIFRGREPDEQRWDLMDPGPLDSWSIRGWYRPSDALAFQISHGFLTQPEELEEGNVRRTTLSGSWRMQRGDDWTATTVAFGRNDKHNAAYNAFLAEGTHTFGKNAAYGRLELLQVESDVLRFGVHAGQDDDHDGHEEIAPSIDVVTALTLGGVRRLRQWNGWDIGAGADVTFYGVPTRLQATHGKRPVSFHVFVRVRPPAPMGRMLDMIMTKGMH